RPRPHPPPRPARPRAEDGRAAPGAPGHRPLHRAGPRAAGPGGADRPRAGGGPPGPLPHGGPGRPAGLAGRAAPGRVAPGAFGAGARLPPVPRGGGMTWILVKKLLRDLRLTLAVFALLLGAFQVLWYKITERILGQLAPFFNTLGGLGGLEPKDIEAMVFEGPGKIIRSLIGGSTVDLNTAVDVLSIGLVHPLVQIILCIWAVGRGASALAGEVDRGTMELLIAQPLARF